MARDWIQSAAVFTMAASLSVLSGCKEEPKPVTLPPNKAPTTQPHFDESTCGPASSPAAAAAAAGDGMMASAKEQAQKYMDEVKQAIADKDVSKAKAAYAKLEEMKSKLPEDWQKKIDDMKPMIDAADATSGLKVPSLPGSK